MIPRRMRKLWLSWNLAWPDLLRECFSRIDIVLPGTEYINTATQPGTNVCCSGVF